MQAPAGWMGWQSHHHSSHRQQGQQAGGAGLLPLGLLQPGPLRLGTAELQVWWQVLLAELLVLLQLAMLQAGPALEWPGQQQLGQSELALRLQAGQLPVWLGLQGLQDSG